MNEGKLGNNNTGFSNKRARRWFAASLVVGAFFVAACAQTPDSKSSQPSFNVHAAEETFTTGLRLISERYIDNINVASLAEEGMKGFQAIDPGLNLVRDGAVLRLAYNGANVATYNVPSDQDSRAWGALTARLVLAARDTSHDMRQASLGRIYEAVFDGALSHLDIFSRYAGPDEAKKNRSRRDGFGGIGIRFKLADKSPVITRLIPLSPAEKAGLKVGDIITHINGTLAGSERPRLNTLAKALRGTEGSDVIITVRRDGQTTPLNFFLTRAHIVAESVRTSFKNGVMVARIKSFNRNTASDLARDLTHYRNTMGADLRGVVIDMRGNPGGLLKEAVKVADLFLTQGDILDTRGRHPASLQHYEAGGGDLSGGLPLVVMIDGKSASAAEIVASALQDRDRAVVVGTASYGKGSVQTVMRLPNDGELTLTWSRFITPSGYTLHGLGVFPAVCTSGSSNVEEVMARSLHNTAQTAMTLTSWRRTPYTDHAHRKQLRTACLSESRTANAHDTDLDVATRLIDQPRQYAEAQLLSQEPAAFTAELAY